jgi:hypothetical protein
MLAKIIALVAHEILDPIIAEYRKLDADEPELSCVSAVTETRWHPAPEVPATAVGFSRQDGAS